MHVLYPPDGVTVFLEEIVREHLCCIWERVLSEVLLLLRRGQRLVVAGCFSGFSEDQAMGVGVDGVQPLPELRCEADEADTRVWLHVVRTEGTCKLVCSPDREVYHIGLPLVACLGL